MSNKEQFSVGDIVSTKNTKHVGFITKVYNSPVKTTYQVSWFNSKNAINNDLAIEGYYLEKV